MTTKMEGLPRNALVKICGMRESDNIIEIAALMPAYLGFIFAEDSPRYFEGTMPLILQSVKKVGVYVAASIEIILQTVEKHALQLVQLHGNESVDFCQELKKHLPTDVQIIKVFSIGQNFDFEMMHAFESCCDFFLLDAKGRLPGGNGTQFNWQMLEKYTSAKPFFLSGGIGVEDVAAILEIQNSQLPLYAIDCNSKLELSAGVKSKKKCEELLENFKNKL